MPHAKVLVVDDDTAVLDAVRLTLERGGYQVETTSDVFGLPLRVGNIKPDVILLDVDLPATTGDQLAMNLKKLRSSRDCKIIFHSAEDEEKLDSLVHTTGALGYIPKGISRVDFLARLRNFLEGI